MSHVCLVQPLKKDESLKCFSQENTLKHHNKQIERCLRLLKVGECDRFEEWVLTHNIRDAWYITGNLYHLLFISYNEHMQLLQSVIKKFSQVQHLHTYVKVCTFTDSLQSTNTHKDQKEENKADEERGKRDRNKEERKKKMITAVVFIKVCV